MNQKSKFTELIAVRFTEQELARLQEAATNQGVGTSTLVRLLVNRALKPVSETPRRMTFDEFREVMSSTLARLELDKEKVDGFLKDISVGDPDDPALLLWAGQIPKWEEFTSIFLKSLLASLGIEVILPESQQSEEASPPARESVSGQSGNLITANVNVTKDTQ